jgi:hypothetical protein
MRLLPILALILYLEKFRGIQDRQVRLRMQEDTEQVVQVQINAGLFWLVTDFDVSIHHVVGKVN